MGLFGFLKKKKDDTTSVAPGSGQSTDVAGNAVSSSMPPTSTTPPTTGSAPTNPIGGNTTNPVPPVQ